MSRQSQEEVAAAARRRLELLGRELDQAGLRRVDDDRPEAEHDDPWDADPAWAAEPSPRVGPGRHVRDVRDGPGRPLRAAEWAARLVPDSWRGRVGLAPPTVLLVVALVAVAAVATAVAVLRMGGDSQPVGAPRASTPLVPVASAGASSGASAAPVGAVPSAGPTVTAASARGTVTVDVAGRVRRPGVATLPAGARVIDALRHAGGARGGVDLSGLNLARVLVDGEQILVGRPAPAAGSIAASAAASAAPPTGALVDLNTATAEQLDTLPGVGPVTAQKILAWRTAHGAFSSVDELLEVDGIGEKTLADLAPMVTL